MLLCNLDKKRTLVQLKILLKTYFTLCIEISKLMWENNIYNFPSKINNVFAEKPWNVFENT